jgi:UDP-N-acetylmuramoylalanine--D-glutamate ligase
LNLDPSAIPGMRVTVMGLGVHGGGLESARFFARRGAQVTVTDLREPAALEPSIDALAGLPIRYVLGTHEEADFTRADLVIKNPAVPATSRYLGLAPRVETDISVFLMLASCRLVAVTGTKGKSTTVSAVHAVLKHAGWDSFLGGNITVSPLSFLDHVGPTSVAVLELSSWQLGDLRATPELRPEVAAITTILPDHLDRYRSMDEYVSDKRVIYRYQDPVCSTLCDFDDAYGRSFADETPGTALFFSTRPVPSHVNGAYLQKGLGYVRRDGEAVEVLPERVAVAGGHGKRNLLIAGLAAHCIGVPASSIREGLQSFPGVEHRLEYVATKRGARFYNDSAATIPESLIAAVQSMDGRCHLIAGGADKKLDFGPLRRLPDLPVAVYLLAGSATPKIMRTLDAVSCPYFGPFDALEPAVHACAASVRPGETVLLAPGCASFGMFENEFHRGRRFKEIVAALPN